MTIQSINPATGEVIETFEPFSQQRIDEALDRAQQAFRQWRSASYDERATLVREIAKTLRAQKERLARTITLEMGKPIAEAEAEVEKCAWNCDFYAEEAKRFLANEPAPSTAQESYVAFRPLGVVLAVMPWNYPLWQVFRFAAPALMAGNVGVLKHASNVTRCALEIERVVSEAAQAVGAPKDLFQALIVPGSEVDKLIKDRRIAAVTLTGSDPAGVSVATAAGSVLKKTVLELGGSDAFIILDDADIEAAAQMAAKARFQNTGQSCIAAKRFIVVESVADAFERAFVKATEALKVGDPLDKDTQVGAMARLDLREDLDRQVRESLAQGAKALTGALWTRDTERGERVAAQIESGAVFINGMTASDPRLPFGGVKRSGYGRELSSYGIREFVNIQTVWIGPVKGAAPVSAAAE
jgi:succinate-semialdehyde dehydrogenase/glutarate-semialdehyde dehydrogenase